jgi:hypothetical protein
MKNLNLFLWIFTTAIATYFAYHTYTHTRIRHNDLESVMQQNLAVEKGITTLRKMSLKELYRAKRNIEKQGNNPKDIVILQEAESIKNYKDSLMQIVDSLIFMKKNAKTDSIMTLEAKNIAILNTYSKEFTKFVNKQRINDNTVRINSYLLMNTNKHYLPFMQLSSKNLKLNLAFIEYEGIINTFGWFCDNVIYFDRINTIALAKSKTVKMGQLYEANMFLYSKIDSFRPILSISEGQIQVEDNNIFNIIIPNVKIQKNTNKILRGIVKIAYENGSDSAFSISTSYTVKKK